MVLERAYHSMIPEWACPPVCRPMDLYMLELALVALLVGLFEEQITAFIRRRSRKG